MDTKDLEKFWIEFNRMSKQDRMTTVMHNYLHLVTELSKTGREVPTGLKAKFNAWLNDLDHRFERDEEMMRLMRTSTELKR